MKIAIFGLGYVGLTGIACLIEQGYEIVGVDISESKVASLKRGECPINEPGVEELINQGIKENRATFTTSSQIAIDQTDIAFVCVGTPSDVTGSHNMSYIINVSTQISEALSNSTNDGCYDVVYRSTMAPGSLMDLIMPIFESKNPEGKGKKWDLFYNPEFLRESTAIKDYYNPPKIVIGKGEKSDTSKIDQIYAKIEAPRFYVGLNESEITKFLDNSFHALKVSFANEIGRVCKTLNIDTEQVMDIFLADTKLNISTYYLRPGGAFGGSCLPKDVRALNALAIKNGLDCQIINNIISSNESHKKFLLDYVEKFIKHGDDVLIVGLSFKTNTDDLRESPQVDLVQNLLGRGYNVKIYDPDIKVSKLHGRNLAFSYSNIPHLERYMISPEELESAKFDVVLMTKKMELPVQFDQEKIINLDRI